MAKAAFTSSDEVWRECVSWLTRWNVLRPDHRTNSFDATIVELANNLRDGVMLCTLLSKIDPTCIDMKEVNMKPAMARFLCLRNIHTFLKVCKTEFGLSDSDLFEESMLFDLLNFHKVLCTLSKLSLTPRALRRNILGFSVHNEKSRDDEEIYQSLKTIEPPIYNAIDPVEYGYYGHDVEDTYQSLMQLQNVKDQRDVLLEPLEKRDHVVKELVDTEKNYVEVLSKLKRNFMLKLANTFPPESQSVIFHNIPELYDVHQLFLNQLNKMVTDKSVKLSSIFIQNRENFLLYGSYCSNLSTAMTVLQDICDKESDVRRKIEELERLDNNGKFKLRDILSVPMQRILKYHLLLEKLIEFTDAKHEEYANLKKAKEVMVDVAAYINEYARDTEQLSVIKHVQENITECEPFSLEQFGKLIKDGEIKIKPHDDGKMRTRYVFIFQKCMILCKPLKDNKFSFRDKFNLNDFQVDDSHNRATLNQNARWSYQWYLVKVGKSIAYTCGVRTIQIKEQMIKALRDCIDNLKPLHSKTTHKFEIITFEKPTSCHYCSKFLKGRILQGYKCKDCSINVHKECISGNCGVPPALPLASHHSPPKDGENLRDKLWFVGEMERPVASIKLQSRPNGTYLIRIRPQSESHNRFALSLKTEDNVKHMKICSSGEGSCEKYYLSPAKFFKSIEQLVVNYQNNSLKECFERLPDDTKLQIPYKQMRAVANADFETHDEKCLPLKQGHEILVVCQEGYCEGWWKGSCNINGKSRVGFFPSTHVKVLEILHNV